MQKDYQPSNANIKTHIQQTCPNVWNGGARCLRCSEKTSGQHTDARLNIQEPQILPELVGSDRLGGGGLSHCVFVFACVLSVSFLVRLCINLRYVFCVYWLCFVWYSRLLLALAPSL